jgi:hypothetical protein
MSLVHLIAADFTSARFRASLALQASSFLALGAGTGLMCVIAIWA